MNAQSIEIRPFDRDASETNFEALNQHINRIRSERLPDDPPIPLQETIQNLRSIPPFVELRQWAGWMDGGREIAALGDVVILRTEENQRLAQFEINVLPQYRRRGVGRRLLRRIAELAGQEGRSVLMTNTNDRIPGGAAFMQRIGAMAGLAAHTNQLRLADVDCGLLDDWLRTGQRNLEAFELGFWDGPYPEDLLPAIAGLVELTNQQPLGSLEIEDIHVTPEQLRQLETNLFARGNQRWTLFLRERATGNFAGYTETVWNPNRPELLRQELTGVFPQYRNKGLGRWLKAAMLDKILRHRPQVKYVRTGNADSNAAMLKINTLLGFKPYSADTLWQVELQQVNAYLQASGESE
jgi:GNAT superfamily N-acetyltransferase